jgi:AraC-like DNA-binding protein
MIQWATPDAGQPKPVFPMPPLQEQVLAFYPFEPVEVEYLPSHKKVQSPSSIIVGRRINRVNLHISYHHLIVQVGFQPGGLFRLLRIPMDRFEADEGYDSGDVMDKETKFVTEQLHEASTFDDMVVIVEHFLLSKVNSLKESLPIDNAIGEIIKKGGLINIDYIAAQACISVRQLERLFYQRAGVSPKFYARLIRFTKAWIMKENNPHEKWTTIAYQCGYFDQMHLIRDFKEFTGVSPTIIENDLNKTPFKLGHKLAH